SLFSPENTESLKKIGEYVDIKYTLGGIGLAILLLSIYQLIIAIKTARFSKKFQETPQESFSYLSDFSHLNKPSKIVRLKEARLQKGQIQKLRIHTLIPVLCITAAELLIFFGKMEAAVWMHVGTLIAFSLAYMLIKDPEIHKIHQALMLLPVLRLINLSMPVFFETTLYTFVFVYAPLAIPVAVIVIHQRHSLEQIGISMKNIEAYMILSVPAGFFLGLGEFLTIRAGYLVPDLTLMNLLKLSVVMVFFVGLVEEVIFRSILQTRLQVALSVQEAILITSILFGLMHSGYGTFHEIIYTGFVGLIMGLTFYKTKSLPFVAVLHGLVNVFLFGVFPLYLSA
ncbi:MAG: lysostaphin resistance A-like protein, partial [Methanosarcina sp.]